MNLILRHVMCHEVNDHRQATVLSQQRGIFLDGVGRIEGRRTATHDIDHSEFAVLVANGEREDVVAATRRIDEGVIGEVGVRRGTK